MVSARFLKHSRRAAKSLRSKKLFSQGCEVGFHLDVLSFQLAAYIGQLQKEIHPTVQKGCEITSQQKGDFATLCKMLPSAWSDWLQLLCFNSELHTVWSIGLLTSWALKWYINASIGLQKVLQKWLLRLSSRICFMADSLCFFSLQPGFTLGKWLLNFAQDSS